MANNFEKMFPFFGTYNVGVVKSGYRSRQPNSLRVVKALGFIDFVPAIQEVVGSTPTTDRAICMEIYLSAYNVISVPCALK